MIYHGNGNVSRRKWKKDLNLYFCCVSEMTDRHLIKSHICKCWEPVIYVAIEVDLRKWKRREDLLQLSDNFSFLWPFISLCSSAINRYRLCTRTNIVTSFSTYIAIFSSRRLTSICLYVKLFPTTKEIHHSYKVSVSA